MAFRRRRSAKTRRRGPSGALFQGLEACKRMRRMMAEKMTEKQERSFVPYGCTEESEEYRSRIHSIS